MFSSINSRGSSISNHLNPFFNIKNFQSTDISGISVTGTQPYNVYAFTNTGITYNIDYYFPTSTIMYVLAVGGGGGGGSVYFSNAGAGGGGAGGVVMTSVTLPGGLNNFKINVGSGGAGSSNNLINGNDGNDTTISFNSNNLFDISAGGGGGGDSSNNTMIYTKLGSGGGYGYGRVFSKANTLGRYYTIYATNGHNQAPAAGGGGGGAGIFSGNNKNGGDGIRCNLNGIKDFNPSGTNPYGLYYWGGGGGGGTTATGTSVGHGGIGGGGAGSLPSGTYTGGSGINNGGNGSIVAGAGGKNTGGGGGGGGNTSGGAGGSGIVVIAFSYFFTPANLLITNKLVINLDSSVFDISCNWIDQTANGYNYTQYNAYSSTLPTTTSNITTKYLYNFPVLLLNSTTPTKYLWLNKTTGFDANLLNSYTYEMWVYSTVAQNATLIYEQGQNGFSGWSVDSMSLSSLNYINSYLYQTSNISSNYNINNWYQIISVYDSINNIFTQYVNGNFKNSISGTRSLPNGGGTPFWLILGSNTSSSFSGTGSTGTFQGYIGSFRGYNIALSPSQILQNYNYYRPTIFSFNPNSITGLSLWLDASDLSNNAFGSAPIYNYGNIGQFVNKATGTIYKGSGNITLNSIGLNNRPTLQFTGTQDFSGNIIITGQYVAIYIVGTNNYLNSPKTLYPRIIALTGAKSEADYTNPLYCIVGTLQTLIYSQKKSILSDCSNISNLNPFLFCNWFDNINVNTVCYTNSNVSYNTKPNVGNFDISYVTIGSGHQSNNNSYFVGNISEILVYSSSDVCSTATSSANNRAIIEGYLSWKWGLQGNLPTNHAYYNYPP